MTLETLTAPTPASDLRETPLPETAECWNCETRIRNADLGRCGKCGEEQF